jgi:eukaryotic-like serine/threonine-protein kinase
MADIEPIGSVAQGASFPRMIGPFTICSVLGKGGMGVVYRAIDSRTDEPVALKTVHVAHEVQLASIRQEIHALSRIRHPGVVRIVGEGVLDGLPWYAMELLEGLSFAAYIDNIFELNTHAESTLMPLIGSSSMSALETRTAVDLSGDGPATRPRAQAGPPPSSSAREITRSLSIVRRLCAPLAFLHGEGIVHRDIKPQNIFIKPGDQPVLMDFGLASITAGFRGREVLDVVSSVAGTPSYMAPEQIRGDLIDARSDLYSLGCLLYHLLTGQPPFVGLSDRDILRQHLTDRPITPSERASWIPPGLDRLVLGLLEKRPRDRIGHAEDVVAAITELGLLPDEPESCFKARTYVYRPALVGRDKILKELGWIVSGAIGGRGSCVLLGGESGIGKTYLALEVARRASTHNVRVVSGTCVPVGAHDERLGGVPLHPFAGLLRRIADRCLSAGPSESDRLLGPRGKILAACDPALASLPGQQAYPDPPALTGPAARDRMLEALGETIAVFASDQPLLILLDDLQWADELSLRFLTTLPEGFLAKKRLLFLGTYRTEETTPPLLEMLSLPYVRHLSIGRLDEGTVRFLVHDMLAIERSPDELIQLLSRKAEGNPFFVAEYLRTAVAEGLIQRVSARRLELGAGENRASAGAAALTLPDSLRELVSRRLDGLTAAGRHIAEVAAVIGREFDGDLLKAAAQVDEIEAMEGLSELLARQLIEPLVGQHFRFLHDKLFEVTYERISEARRPGLHLAVAQAIEARTVAMGPHAAPYPGPQSGPVTMGPQSGPVTMGPGAMGPSRALYYPALARHYANTDRHDQTLFYLERAGERSLSTAAYGETTAFFRRALELDARCAALGSASVGPRRRARWERRLGDAHFNLGDLAASEQHSLKALGQLGLRLPRSKLGWARELLGQLARQIAHRSGLGGGRVVDPEGRDDLKESALAGGTMAWRYFFVDDLIGVVTMSLLSVNQVEAASPAIDVASPYAWLGYTAGTLRLHKLARAYFQQAHESSARSSDQPAVAFTCLMEGLYHIGFGDWEEVEAIGARMLVELRGVGDPQNMEAHMTNLANMEFYTGQYEASIRHFDEVLRSAQARRNVQHTAWGLYAGGLGRLALGWHQEAIPRLEEAKALLATQKDIASQIICHGLLGLAYLRRGERARARALAEDTSARIRQVRAAVYSTYAGYAAAAEIFLELSREEPSASEASRLLRHARRAATDLWKFSLMFPFAAPAASLHGGQVLALSGRPRLAARAFQRAVALAQRFRMPYEEAQARFAIAQNEQDGEAAGSLDEAEKIFARLGCTYHLGRVVLLRQRDPRAGRA